MTPAATYARAGLVAVATRDSGPAHFSSVVALLREHSANLRLEATALPLEMDRLQRIADANAAEAARINALIAEGRTRLRHIRQLVAEIDAALPRLDPRKDNDR